MAAAVVARRRRRRIERVFRDFSNPMEIYDDQGLIRRYRLSRPLILSLLALVKDDLSRETKRNHALPPIQQLLAALQFFGNGNFQITTGDLHALSKSSVSRIIRDVSKSICRRLDNVNFPDSIESQREVKSNFHNISGFPNVLGCIDGSLISIKSPTVDEPAYICRKGYHSINVQAVCDHSLRFTNIVAKYPGSSHDSHVWNNCSLHRKFEAGDFGQGWLLGDSGYACKSYLLTPLLNPTNRAEERYNSAHKRTRCTVERMFGVWKSRFRCIHKSAGSLNYSPERSCTIIVACAKLHNMCIDHGLPHPTVDDTEEDDDVTQHIPVNLDGQRVRQRLILQRFM